MHTYTCVYIHTPHTHMYVRIYTHVCIYACICIHIKCICVHTYEIHMYVSLDTVY